MLVVFGGLWLSVRGQHPYTGHISGWAIAVAVVLVVINIGWTAWAIGRAGAGVSGPAQRKWQAWTGIMVAAWIIGYAITAPLYHAGVSHPVWGLYPASAPLLIIGLAGAAVAAAFRYWPLAGTCPGHRRGGRRSRVRGPGRLVADHGHRPVRRVPGHRRVHRPAAAPQHGAAVTTELDPLIHVPTRLRIVATLAALPDGDALSFTRLQDMLALTPGNLIIQLRKLEDADYISSTKTRNGSAQKTTVALTSQGRAALSAYTQALRDLLGGLDVDATSPDNTVYEISAEDAKLKRRAEIATRQESP